MGKLKSNHEVPADQLRWHCNPKYIPVKTTNEVKPSKEIIGQERALRALRLGLEMKHPGYNVFVTGFSGTGRMTTIKRLLTELENRGSNLNDLCYVHNFRNTDQPTLLALPVGEGCKFSDDMEMLVQDLMKDIPASFETKRFKDERKRLMEHFQERQQSVLKEFEKRVKEKGFEVVQVQVGSGMRPDITPVVNNNPVSFDQLDNLLKEGQVTKEQIEQLSKDRLVLEGQMEIVLRELRNIERKARESMDELAERFILPIVRDEIDHIRKSYNNEKLHRYLDDVQENIMDDLNRFRPAEEQQSQIMGMPMPSPEEDRFTEYRVNVVADNSETKGVPIVIETNPKFKNIFGTIDREVDRNGVWRTDFTLIKAGSLLHANGGYLVINALDALIEQGVWQNLKRTLRNNLLEIQPIETGLFGASSALKPEPIDIDVKVVMLGDASIYFILYDQDDDFKKIFKVRADFDTEMAKKPQTIRHYISFIKMICDDEKLKAFNKAGIAAVIEYGTRLAERQEKLSTRFNIIADILRESNYWATKDDALLVNDQHVLKAIDERVERVKLMEEKIEEMILNGEMMIDTEGSVVGQVNGLTIYDVREYSFGKPSRITAKTSIGNAGIINIERESELSGPTHNKGVLILSGYLHGMYAQKKPLAMTASLTFEQSYGGVDGDSASSTEIYALLSSLSKLPLRQDIAVTGSVNQNGEIQPIGGVNQKVEGFFSVCKARGLTGKQGVIIPHQNKKDLMLRHEVVHAVRQGKFHVYAIASIDEGIEILTGKKAGKKLRSGAFEKDSVHHLVDHTLTEYAKHWKELNQ
ncbi:MAG TPA: ATP-binding protein [Bacteroidota bacterium]|jgi:ATP-dependent Lon protease|nr:ATP-binding protein [Bacteroidota bacterium]